MVGAGAMGGYFAGRIAENGGAVVPVDVDGDRLAAIARDGLRVGDDAGDRRVPVAVAKAADRLPLFGEATVGLLPRMKGLAIGFAWATGVTRETALQ